LSSRNRLSALAVERAKTPGRYPDGAGLYLQVTSAASRSWVYRYTLNGRSREMGLGPLGPHGTPAIVSLEEARRLAQDARSRKAKGEDPLDARAAAEAAKAAEEARRVTFKTAAARYIEAHSAKWRNQKHRDQWESTLKAYAYPQVGETAVSEIDTEMVLRILRPIWATKTETASRVRGRIEIVLDWSKWKGYRHGENPARWRGNLSFELPSRRKIRPVVHHPAMAYRDVPDFVPRVRSREGLSARALELAILTACRTSEIIGISWKEIDLDNQVWTVPAGRMKALREHRVPLSTAAADLLRRMKPASNEPIAFVFPGRKRGKHLSNGAMLQLLDRMGRGDVTTHGFRSTFKDWTLDRTSFGPEVSEMALAHVVKDETEAAYLRSDLFIKRRKLMEAWARYCGSSAGAAVVSFEEARMRAAT
jgi:integrase